MNPPKSLLASKLARILGEVGQVEKTGHNSFHHYDYVTESALVWAVREKLAREGIVVFTSVESQSHEVITTESNSGPKQTLLTTVQTLHTFVDGESGETFAVKSQGQGSDTGDKGVYKAITGAMKYFLYKNFMVPTEDDPERDERTDERTAGGITPKRDPQPTPNPPPAGGAPDVPKNQPEVPREISAGRLDKFRDKKWTAVVIHFGKNRGTALGKLKSKSLEWYIAEWQPKPYNGKVSEADLDLRAALDVANDEWQ